MSWLIAVLSVVGGGIAGSGLTFLLTLRRERRRTLDAYRTPQRAAIGSIVAATNDLVLRAYEFQTFINNSADQSDGTGRRSHYTDAEADVISGQVNRAVIGIDEAFSIGKLTVVEARCYETMVTAYKEFEKVQAEFVNLESMPRTSENLRQAAQPFVTHAVQLKRHIRELVDVGREQLAPTQSRREDRALDAARARLKEKYQLKK